MSQLRSAAVRPHRLAFAIAALLPFGTALAQETPVTTAESREASTLDAVQVTAQRRVENIQDVPVSISSVSAEKLDVLGSGGNDVRFLSARVPSLNIESSYGRAFPRFYIRGLGNTDFDLNASQPVSLIYDEVVQESPLLKGFPVFDLERIEVLRGPQGTLFGRNTSAGAISVVRARSPQAVPRRRRHAVHRRVDAAEQEVDDEDEEGDEHRLLLRLDARGDPEADAERGDEVDAGGGELAADVLGVVRRVEPVTELVQPADDRLEHPLGQRDQQLGVRVRRCGD